MGTIQSLQLKKNWNLCLQNIIEEKKLKNRANTFIHSFTNKKVSFQIETTRLRDEMKNKLNMLESYDNKRNRKWHTKCRLQNYSISKKIKRNKIDTHKK